MKELVCGNRARKVSKWTSGLAKLDLNTTASKSPHLISTAAAPYHSDDSSLPIMRRCQGSGDRGRKQKGDGRGVGPSLGLLIESCCSDMYACRVWGVYGQMCVKPCVVSNLSTGSVDESHQARNQNKTHRLQNYKCINTWVYIKDHEQLIDLSPYSIHGCQVVFNSLFVPIGWKTALISYTHWPLKQTHNHSL